MSKGMFAEKEFWVGAEGAPEFFGGDDTAEAGQPSPSDPLARASQCAGRWTWALNPCLTGLSSNFPVN